MFDSCDELLWVDVFCGLVVLRAMFVLVLEEVLCGCVVVGKKLFRVFVCCFGLCRRVFGLVVVCVCFVVSVVFAVVVWGFVVGGFDLSWCGVCVFVLF